MEKVLPVLRATYLERGFELDFIDPHWGVLNLVSDEHGDDDLCVSLVKSAMENTDTINFLVRFIDNFNLHIFSMIGLFLNYVSSNFKDIFGGSLWDKTIAVTHRRERIRDDFSISRG